MSTPEAQDADNQPVLPPSATAEALIVPPQDCPEVAFAEKVRSSTPSPGKGAEDATRPEVGATGPYLAAGGSSLPPMSSDPTIGFPGGAGADSIPGHEILGELGRGGMGVVYKARHLNLKRLVAVKMIRAGERAGPEHRARFRTEAEAIARLQHPNIVQIFEVGEHREMPFFSLEFCGRGSLAAKLHESPLLPVEAAALLRTLAQAMQAAHDKGVIHRDLKPANVLLADDGTPKISDFGLAKKLDEAGQTIPGVLMGTPSYMAPEQADSWSPVGPPVDVYALGAILYECLTGRPPFKAATAYDTVLQVVRAEPVPPRQLNPAVPRDLETICLKCLEKEPDKRYSPAQALADDLDRFVKKEPILARPATRRERFAKWCRRNPRVAALSGVIAVAVVAYAVTFTWLSVNLREQTRTAKEAERVANLGQMKALDHAFHVARTWATRSLQPRLGKKEDEIRRENFNIVRQTVKEIAGDMQFTPFNLVAAHQLAGDFARDIGMLGEARGEYQQSYALVEPITRKEPGNDKARANMALILQRLADSDRILKGDVETARRDLDKARELRQEIAEHPRSGDYTALENRIALAFIALDRVRLEFSQGNLAAAWQQLSPALETRRAWVKETKGDEQAMAASFLSEACMWMGVVLAHQADQEGAEKLLQEASERSDRLAKKHEEDPSFLVDLADIYAARGEVQALQGDWKGASTSYEKARDYVIKAQLPTAQDSRGMVVLARVIEGLGAVADKKGDANRAKGRREMSLKIRENLTRIEPDCVTWKAAWLLALAHMDRQADDEAAKLAKQGAGNAELLLQLARYHAVRAGRAAAPAQRRAATEKALALLNDAVKVGYADRFVLACDPDLAPLRQEAGFQALLKRLAP